MRAILLFHFIWMTAWMNANIKHKRMRMNQKSWKWLACFEPFVDVFTSITMWTSSVGRSNGLTHGETDTREGELERATGSFDIETVLENSLIHECLLIFNELRRVTDCMTTMTAAIGPYNGRSMRLPAIQSSIESMKHHAARRVISNEHKYLNSLRKKLSRRRTSVRRQSSVGLKLINH